jgi:tRNA pseudouridine55 synthase
VGGHLTALRRTAVGPYTLDHARTLADLSDGFAQLPIADAARAAFASLELTEEQERDVRVGRRLDLVIETITAVFAPSGEFLALYEPAGSQAKPLAVFVG